MQVLIPELVAHKPLNITDEVTGSTYEHTIKTDGEELKYEITILEYIEVDKEKKFNLTFKIENMFQAYLEYKLTVIDENSCKVTLTCKHIALSQAGQDMLTGPSSVHIHDVTTPLKAHKIAFEA